ncbi:MAG: potassium transporter Kup [Opitutales bacterium]
MSETSQGNAVTRPLTFAAVLAALGVVFGDIGTSPLYAFKECLRVSGPGGAGLGTDAVIPLLSLILWSLIFVVTIKYVLLVMEANDEGEGGVMTLVSLASAHQKQAEQSQEPERNGKPRSKRRNVIIMLGVFGAALLYGDGVITPAISVLSALEGLREANDKLGGGVSHQFFSWFIPAAAVTILFVLFRLQKAGTGRVGMYFGPVTLVWFISIALTGCWSLWTHSAVSAQLLASLNPFEGVLFMVHNPMTGILVLGSVFLAVTGAEALYADMGHFGQGPIRTGWYFVVFPALILNYFGQGAWALDPANASELARPGFSPFFNMAPAWAQIPLVMIATLAAIIASQALISGAFSITMQAIQLNFLPRMRIERTSDVESGQIYVATVNWMLMCGSIYLVLHYGTSEQLANAYGIAVSLTMLVTTVLFGQYIKRKMRVSGAAAYAMLSPFIALELLFVTGNAHKIWPNGWFPLAIGVLVYLLMSIWNKGRIAMKEKMRETESTGDFDNFLDSVEDRFLAGKLARVKGTAVYMAGSTKSVPMALAHNLKHNRVLHDHIILVTLIVDEDRAIVPPSERVSFQTRGPKFCKVASHEEFPSVLSVTGKFGFREKQDAYPVLEAAYHELNIAPNELETTYFLSRETIVRATTLISLNGPQERIFEILNRNALSATAYFNLPPGRVVELGMQVEL